MNINIQEILHYLPVKERVFAQYFIDEGNFFCLSILIEDTITKTEILRNKRNNSQYEGILSPYDNVDIDKLENIKCIISELLNKDILK